MKSSSLALFSGLLILSQSQSFADVQEFLEPISQAEDVRLSQSGNSYNDYFVKKETYFAKRYRLVKVNTHLLLNSSRIRVSLFGDLALNLETVEVATSQGNQEISWKGRVVNPGISVNDLVENGVPSEAAPRLLDHITSVHIDAAQISFDQDTRRKYPFYRHGFEERLAQTSALSHDETSTVYDVQFSLPATFLPNGYELRPIASDPRYHILIEIDPEKAFSYPIESRNPNSTYPLSSGEVAKEQRYRDFIDSLGPDPRPAEQRRE